jgi:hypothetical protein
MKYLLIIAALFCSLPQISAQNNIAYGAGISYTNGAPSFTPPARTSRVAIDTVTGKWYHFNTPGGWQLLGNTIEEIAGCTTPAYTPTKGDSKVVINNCTTPEVYFYNGSTWVWINEGTTYYAGEGIRIENDTIILDSLELNELHNVFVPNPINNQVLTWDNIDKRWEAKTVADSSATNELQTLSVATNTATLSSGGGSVTIAGAGINTVGTAGTTITVTGTEVDGSVSNELQTLSTGTNTLTLSDGGGTVTVDTDPGDDVTGSGASGQVSFWTGGQTQSGDNGLFWNNTDKRLGIGTNSPGAPLQVRGSGTSSSTWTAQFHNSATGGNNAFMIRDDGNVGIGTNTLQAKLHVTGNVYVPTGFRYMGGGNALNAGMSFWGTQDGNTGWGGFMGRNMYYDGTNYYYSSTNAAALWGTVAGLWVQGNSLNTIALGLIARPPTEGGSNVISTNTDRLAYMRLAVTYSGNIGINNTNPSARLHVVGSGSTSSTWTAQFHNSATGGNNAFMIRDDGNIGVRTNAPTDLIDINGANGYSQLRLRTAYTPTGTADANGNTGDVSWDANYIYIKTAAGWKRSALSTF